MSFVVTIDGPSGSGKGTIARKIANAMNFALLDSGALYRISGLAAMKNKVDLSDESALVKLVETLDIQFKVDADSTQVLLNGEDVSKAIREEAIGMAASKIAPLGGLRTALLDRQRNFVGERGLVADGRDMGTVVFPEAAAKIFLTASAQERARRRIEQLREAGHSSIDEAKILSDIIERDERDQNRAASPLVAADDALNLDSTSLSIEEVYSAAMQHIRSKQ